MDWRRARRLTLRSILRPGMWIGVRALLCAPLLPPPALRPSALRMAHILDESGLCAIDAWHARATEALVAKLPVKARRDGSLDLSPPMEATVRAWEPTSQSERVAWCSALSLSTATYASRSITVWNAPSVEVPHLFLRLGVSTGGDASEAPSPPTLELEIDYRHRLAAGYEGVQPDGGYPEPTSREEFAQASVRRMYDETFFTAEARQWWEAVHQADGAKPLRTPLTDAIVEGRRQFGGSSNEPCSGPLRVSLQFPLSDAAIEAAAEACEAAAARWLGWMAEAPDASWINNRRIYDRDCLVRLGVLRSHAAALAVRLGSEEGMEVALVDAGPQDMMGHNLMQEQGGFGSDPDEGRD